MDLLKLFLLIFWLFQELGRLRPIYLKDNDNFNIDPLHEINDYKFIVYKSEDTISILNSFAEFDSIKLEENSILINHASNLFTPLNINKLLEYKN